MTTKSISIGEHEHRLDMHEQRLDAQRVANALFQNKIDVLERIVVDQARSIAALEHNALSQPNGLTATGLMMATENAERMVKGRLARGGPADGEWLGPNCGPPIMRPANRIREQLKRLRSLTEDGSFLRDRIESAKLFGATKEHDRLRAVATLIDTVADEIEAALRSSEGSACR